MSAERNIFFINDTELLSANDDSIEKESSLTPKTIRNAVLIGAGINSLCLAFLLVGMGYKVNIVESEDDFRKETFNQQETKTLSVTSFGRHLSSTESIPFNLDRKKNLPLDSISKGGWLVKPEELLSPPEKQWQDAFYKIANEQPEFYNYATKLAIDMNRQGMQKWQELFNSNPELTKDINIRTPLYRIFADIPSVDQKYHYRTEEEIELQKDNNNFKRLTPEEATGLFPGVRNIKEVVQVDGFSINITQLMHNMIEYLEKQGANFMWNMKAKKVLRNKDGFVAGIQAEDKYGIANIIKADDYVISTGNGGNDLLEGTDSHNKVQGLTGLWATLPNIDAINHSFKVMASEQLGVSNITVSADRQHLYVSGGHGFIGLDNDIDLEKNEGASLKQHFLNYLEDVFPDAYGLAVTNGTLDLKKCCSRPSTADGLPIIETIQAENGQLIVSVGGNCGGFQLALLLGDVVTHTLQGKSHILQKALESGRHSISPTVYTQNIRCAL